MARGPNIFFNLVTDENSHTELLCNLMRFAAFRRPMLARFFPDACVNKISIDDLDTQATFRGDGRPDLVIRNNEVYALIEVKVTECCKLTENQPEGYFHVLQKVDKKLDRWLVFLVPKGWGQRQFLDAELKRLKADHHEGEIHTNVVEWEDVLAVVADNELQTLNPFINDFYQMLAARLRPEPITFNTREVLMLFNKDIPTALSKLDQLVLEIRAKSSTYKIQGPDRPRGLCPEEEYAFYFLNDQNEQVFWFGVWMEFWKKTGFPLSFGVWDKYPSAAKEAFAAKYKGDKIVFPCEYGGNWILGYFSQLTLAEENAVEAVWKQLAPVVEAVVKAV